MSKLTVGVAERLRDLVEADIIANPESIHIARINNMDIVSHVRPELHFRAHWLRGMLLAKIAEYPVFDGLQYEHIFRASIDKGKWVDKVLITGIGCWALDVTNREREFMVASTDTTPLVSRVANPRGRILPMSHEAGIDLCGIISSYGSQNS